MVEYVNIEPVAMEANSNYCGKMRKYSKLRKKSVRDITIYIIEYRV